jgi:DNA-directed RNA polymerase subunit H (RpoH/RPB5)
MAAPSLLEQLTRGVRTVAEMLRDRGEDSSALDSLKDDDLASRLRSDGMASLFFVLKPEVSFLLISLLPRPTSIIMRSTLKRELRIPAATDGPTKTLILVLLDKASNFEQHMHKLQEEFQVTIQVFILAQLQFNVTRHAWVPRHVRVQDPTEIKQIMTQYSLKSRYQLPWIQQTDPVARYLDLQPGDIVRIQRHCPTAGAHVVYRCCVSKPR